MLCGSGMTRAPTRKSPSLTVAYRAGLGVWHRAYDIDGGDWERYNFTDSKKNYSACWGRMHTTAVAEERLRWLAVWSDWIWCIFACVFPARNLIATDDTTYSLILLCWNPRKFR